MRQNLDQTDWDQSFSVLYVAQGILEQVFQSQFKIGQTVVKQLPNRNIGKFIECGSGRSLQTLYCVTLG